MIEVELSKIIIDEEKQEQVIVLREKDGSKMLPIVIGLSEAAAIRMEVNGFSPPRPLTHDLIKSLFDTFSIVLKAVIIDKLVNGIFHAKLHFVTRDGDQEIIDARPSDSIAIAVRTKSPIFVQEEVFEKLLMEE